MTLIRQQPWQFEKIQTKHTDKSNRKVDHFKLLNNAKSQIGLVITRYGRRLLVESKSGNLYLCTSRRNIGPSVTGDRIIFQATNHDTGVIVALFERTNQLSQAYKLIATNINQLWLIVAIEPRYQFELIDRYLVIAENWGLPIGIVINKIELARDRSKVKADFSRYESAGYSVQYLSVKTRLNIEQLKTKLNTKTQLFLGQSGVGKSSLINTLIPQLNLRVNAISNKTKLGKHTTTNTALYHVPSGGNLIDSPGVAQFQLDTLTNAQIVRGFREFKPFAGQCRFRNCVHIKEPDCGIKTAVKSGEIHPQRYQNYLALIQ